MNPSKRLASAALLASVLALSACNNEEEPLLRNTAPGPISAFQALSVAEEVGGLVMNDALLVKLVDIDAGACASGGSRTDTASTAAGYGTRATFSACKVNGITYNGTVELFEDSNARRLRFNDLIVETTYASGALRATLSGSLDNERSQVDDDHYDDLDIPELSIDATISQYGRVALARLDIRNYSRMARTNEIADTQSLSVVGRITKSGDYGTYDVDASNVPVDGSDTLRQIFEGHYFSADHYFFAGSYTSGKLHIADRVKAGNYMAFAPCAEYTNASQVLIGAGKMVHFTGKIGASDYNTILDWGLMEIPFLVALFEAP